MGKFIYEDGVKTDIVLTTSCETAVNDRFR